MRPSPVGIETNPRSHLAPDGFFFHLVSGSTVTVQWGWVKGGEEIFAAFSHYEDCGKEGRGVGRREKRNGWIVS